MTREDFIKGILDGNVRDNDIIRYCKDNALCGNEDLDRKFLENVIFDLWKEHGKTKKDNDICKYGNLLRAEDVIVDYFGDIFGERKEDGQIYVLRYGLMMPKEKAYYYRHGYYPDQQIEPEPQLDFKDFLPERLKTNEAVEVFQKAIDAKLIINGQDGLKWNDTKLLLAYFATKVSKVFRLTTIRDKDMNLTTAWKPFEDMFKMQGLKNSKQNWMRINTKFEPTGFEKVDALF